MIDLKDTIEGAEAILLKLWARRDEVTLEQVRDAYAEAYGYLKQGVDMYLEERERKPVVREATPYVGGCPACGAEVCDGCCGGRRW